MLHKRSEKAPQMPASIQMVVKALKSDKYKSVYATAKALGVSETTLRARVNGKGMHVKSNKANQLLTKAKKTMLAKWYTKLSKNGFPPRKKIIEEMAMEIIRRRS
jgi:hypothetical protein